MTKSKRQRDLEQRGQIERDIMVRYEADQTRRWKCGIRVSDAARADSIWASADTEAEAEVYMKLRYARNGGVIPHRLLDEVGWWDSQGVN